VRVRVKVRVRVGQDHLEDELHRRARLEDHLRVRRGPPLFRLLDDGHLHGHERPEALLALEPDGGPAPLRVRRLLSPPVLALLVRVRARARARVWVRVRVRVKG